MTAKTLDLHIGRDGWLFLAGGSNHVLRYFTDPDYFSADLRQAWLNMLHDRHRAAAAIGAQYCHLIAPEKLSVYPEHFVGDLPCLDCAPSRVLPSEVARLSGHPLIVDLMPVFDRMKEEGKQLYFKTDTHWTHEGAWAAAAAVCAAFGVDPGTQYLQRPLAGADLVLDLGGKLDPPVHEYWTMRTPSGRLTRIAANQMVAFKEAEGLENDPGLHVGCSVAFHNATPAVRARLVIFGDSFSEYRDHLLTGALAETFEETHFVWSAQMDWNYITTLRPTYVVSQLAERFMTAVPLTDIEVGPFCRERLDEFLRTRRAAG